MNRLARIKRILSLCCEEAAELSSRRMDEPLSWTDKLAWAGHLLACRSCRRFRRHLAFLRDASGRIAAGMEDATEAVLSDEARARITASIRDAAPE
jgi:hypothetical protein